MLKEGKQQGIVWAVFEQIFTRSDDADVFDTADTE